MIARNALWNLAGLGLPLVVALMCIPPLIDALGTARFGLLTLLWSVLSYVGLFDLGVGRALTQQLAAAIGAGRRESLAGFASDGLALLGGIGVLVGLGLWSVAPVGVAALGVQEFERESIDSVHAIAWAMPFVLLTAGLRGVMEASGAFATINAVRLATGVATILGPLLVVRFGRNDLGDVAWVLAAVRVAGCLAYAVCVARLLPGALMPRSPTLARFAPLLRVGGWMTVANLVGPLMSYIDRFVVGVVASIQVVAWYATPQEIVTRLLIAPFAICNVLFPRLTEVHAAQGGRMAGWEIERLAIGVLFLALLPVTLLLGVFAGPILHHWVGPEFAREGASAMLVLCAGVLANAIAHVPFAAIQARGGARATALLQLVELPCYVVVLWLLASEFGAVGAALAWTLRTVVDLAALWVTARPRPVRGEPARDRPGIAIGALAVSAFAWAAIVPGAWAGVGALCLGAVAWTAALLWMRDDLPGLLSLRKADGLTR